MAPGIGGFRSRASGYAEGRPLRPPPRKMNRDSRYSRGDEIVMDLSPARYAYVTRRAWTRQQQLFQIPRRDPGTRTDSRLAAQHLAALASRVTQGSQHKIGAAEILAVGVAAHRDHAFHPGSGGRRQSVAGVLDDYATGRCDPPT